MASSSDKPKPQLLVIEDEQEAAEFLKGYFQQFGLEVTVASTADEGMALLDSLRPRVVLLDLRLSEGLDGLNVLERQAGSTSPKIIVVTAVIDRNVEERAKGLGACAYLTKPFVLEELERTVLARFRE